MNIKNEKSNLLKKIYYSRNIIKVYLEDNLVTQEDLINLFKNELSYGISVSKRNNSIEYILKSIFNSPFLLCDQTSLSKKIKDLLPFILYSRYNIELEEIDNFYNEGYIGEDEYNKSKDILTFLYFKTSKEGKKIYKEKKQNNNLNIKVKCIKK